MAVTEADSIVVGAGVVGSAIAYGLARAGRKVIALDGADTDFRAARANFGLVWVQGKGMTMPMYQHVTRESSDAWPDFLAELVGTSGVSVDYERKGGLAFCLGEREFETRRDGLRSMQPEVGDVEMVERPQLEAMLPKMRLGAEVTGASFCWRDGHANPLQLLHALHVGTQRRGGEIIGRSKATQIKPANGGFAVHCGERTYFAPQVVIAAGIGSTDIGRSVDLAVPLRPVRGQILVTERMEQFMPLPASGLRQTAEGTVMIGATHEDVGLDSGTTTAAATYLANRALRVAPALAGGRLVRQWSGLRIMTPDGYPIYAESPSVPGAFVAICHSGVTLAAFHAGHLASMLAGNIASSVIQPFHHRRFDVQNAA